VGDASSSNAHADDVARDTIRWQIRLAKRASAAEAPPRQAVVYVAGKEARQGNHALDFVQRKQERERIGAA